MDTIKKVLMERDGMDEESADDMIDAARAELANYIAYGDMDSAERVCEDWFGLEPDYLMELL